MIQIQFSTIEISRSLQPNDNETGDDERSTLGRERTAQKNNDSNDQTRPKRKNANEGNSIRRQAERYARLTNETSRTTPEKSTFRLFTTLPLPQR